jgi:hypothetical protein
MKLVVVSVTLIGTICMSARCVHPSSTTTSNFSKGFPSPSTDCPYGWYAVQVQVRVYV